MTSSLSSSSSSSSAALLSSGSASSLLSNSTSTTAHTLKLPRNEPTSVAYALWASCVPIELQEDLWRVIGSRVCTPICGMLGVPCGYVPVPRPREAARD